MTFRAPGTLGRMLILAGLLNTMNPGAFAQDKAGPAEATRTASSNEAVSAPASAPVSANELTELKAQLQAQQKQIEQLRLALEDQKKLIERASGSAATPLSQTDSAAFSLPEANKLGEVASTTPMIPAAASSAAVLNGQKTGEKDHVSPLYFEIGSAHFTPLGFIDVTGLFRTTNTGNGIGTSFGGIPFRTTVPGQTTENRLSLQNSRVGLRIDAHALGGDILGYLETDFLGNAANNLLVTSNSNVLRLRLFWFDYRKEKVEFLAGQTWSLMTPNRKGLAALPGDLFYTQDVDTNYQAGLSWTRAAEFRFLYHATDHFTAGLAVENPEQYVGGAVTFAGALPSSFAGQFSTGGSNANAPNLHPDVMGKIAVDGVTGGRTAHLELGGLYRTFQAYNPVTAKRSYTSGGGGEVNANVEVAKGFRLLESSFFGTGIGRYIFGLVPDVVADADGKLSTIDTASGIGGFEYTVKPKDNPKNMESVFYGYYGGVYIRNKYFVDSKGKFFGYGFPGSSNSSNRTVQELTLGLTQTLWKNPSYGDLKLMTQYSYLTRNPWSVAAGAPSQARLNMVFVNLRYDLP